MYDFSEIKNDIENLVNKIGVKCHGRVEISLPDGVSVVEFYSKDTGGWGTTSVHSKESDEAFSSFDEYRRELPLLRRLVYAVEEYQQIQKNDKRLRR
jgi:hypothetical protein